jgi:peptide/nickel transport system permease protein
MRNNWFHKLRQGPFEVLFESHVGLVGFLLVFFWIIVALGAPIFAPFDPNEMIAMFNLSPSWDHLLGTDNLGRDILSRLIYGSRPILLLAPLAVFISLVIGAFLGLISGYQGGLLDEVIMRCLDAMLAFPTMLLYMVIIAAVGASHINVVLAIVIAGVPGFARLVRSMVLEIKEREFIQAARLRGDSLSFILLSEILPNCSAPLIVDAALRIGYAAFAIGALGFLGLGLPPPDPDWGRMVSEGRSWIGIAPWSSLFPALAIASLVVGLNLLADGIQETNNKP